MTDQRIMEMALNLARKGGGFVNPNPMVGAVIMKSGEVIGMGYHEKYGGPHAEQSALANCTASPKGATLYVTLEPCCHHGKTPPCTEAIIDRGIGKVVIGTQDLNPLVAGKGIEALRRHGVEVVSGVLEAECLRLNEVFFHYIRTSTPYVIMKYAMTMDGKIATYTGASQWITGTAAREDVHRDRHRYAAIMVGVGTVLADDPRLTSRIAHGNNPIRIVCDTNLRMPLSAHIVETAKDTPTIIATACLDQERTRRYTASGCKIIVVPRKDGHVDIRALMAALGSEKIDSVLLEGGSALNWSALQCGVVNKVKAYIAPKVVGGLTAKTPVSGVGVSHPDHAFALANSTVTRLGDDILIESEVIQGCLQA